ncbi:hypothetical protein J2S19_004858 [Metabacillus malikii]|uniref:Uncharacterized protein n=1 Tax=Metabacillus malikii TaxID=1504265 RepID=A0ABT9ZNZ5_9BACI|nr:hypothetical protein [Metabacillus malikii]
MGEVRPHRRYAPRSTKSVGGLPIDVQTGGASTEIKESR